MKPRTRTQCWGCSSAGRTVNICSDNLPLSRRRRRESSPIYLIAPGLLSLQLFIRLSSRLNLWPGDGVDHCDNHGWKDNSDHPPAGVVGLAGRAGRAGLAGRAGRAARAARAGLAGRPLPATLSCGFQATTLPDWSRQTRPRMGPSQFPVSTDHAWLPEMYATQFMSVSKT